MFLCFFFNDTATTEIYTLSLHDALPIFPEWHPHDLRRLRARVDVELDDLHLAVGEDVRLACGRQADDARDRVRRRSEEHTSELQSRQYLVCRLLLEKKKKTIYK